MKAPHGQTGFARCLPLVSGTALIFFPNWAVTRSMRWHRRGPTSRFVLSPEGRILDISYRDKSYKAWGLDHWVGREWADTVTVESREKIEELLRDAHTGPTSPAPVRSTTDARGRRTSRSAIGSFHFAAPRTGSPSAPTCAISPRCSSVWCARRSKWKRTIARSAMSNPDYRILFPSCLRTAARRRFANPQDPGRQ